MRNTTLCFLVREEEILLPLKKRGFGINRHNGYGGKQEEKETITAAAIRELGEEAKIYANESNLTKRAELEFTFPEKPEWNQRVHIYLLEEWLREPQETEEMRPMWFHKTQIPYAKMWPDDPYWLPHILGGKYVGAKFSLGIDQNTIISQKVEIYQQDPFLATMQS